MVEPELDTLIVANIADLDAAARYLQQVLQPAVGRQIDEIWDAFRKEHAWAGESGFDDGTPWLAPAAWRKPDSTTDDDHTCSFQLGFAEGAGVEAHFWLTELVGAAPGCYGLRWLHHGSRVRAWRRLVGQHPDLVATLRAHGFDYEEAKGSFFLPIRIEQAQLVKALQYEAPEQALEPLEKALGTLVEAKPHFDTLLARTSDAVSA